MMWLGLYAAIYLAMLLHVAVSLVMGRLFGAEMGTAVVGWGRVLRFQLGRTQVRLGILPFSSYTEARGRADRDGEWWRLPAARRLAILLMPWLSYALMAPLLLGSERARASVTHGFSQLFIQLDLTPLLLGFHRVLQAGPFALVLGVVFAKMFAGSAIVAAGNLGVELRLKHGWIFGLGSSLWIGGRIVVALVRAIL